MILHIRITESPDSGDEITHYVRRVELSDGEAISRLSRALDAELGRPARKPRSDRGSTRGAA